MSETITAERLRELLQYDPETGIFTWRSTLKYPGRIKAGSVAGSLNNAGYQVIRIDKKNYKAHRLAWLFMTGSFPDGQIDHKDLNRANNAWKNLRPATASQNKANSRAYKNNKLGIKGVCYVAQMGRYRAKIKSNNKSKRLGYFDTAAAASAAYAKAAAELHGEYANVA